MQQIPIYGELFELHQFVVHFAVSHFVGTIGPITVTALGGQGANLDARTYPALAGVHNILVPEVDVGDLQLDIVDNVGGHVGAVFQPIIVRREVVGLHLLALLGPPASLCSVQHRQLVLQVLQLLLFMVPVVQVLWADDAEQSLDGYAPRRCSELSDGDLELDFPYASGGDFHRQVKRAEGIFAYGYVLKLDFAWKLIKSN